MMQHKNAIFKKILTYESPIEYIYDEVHKPMSIISQSEMATQLDSFTSGVKNALQEKAMSNEGSGIT
jgi:defect-in-organelle-trafficking protein DotB